MSSTEVQEVEVHQTIEPICKLFLDQLMKLYWWPLYQYVEKNPKLIRKVPGFLLTREEVFLYIGRTHIAVEYSGSEVIKELNPKGETRLSYNDFSTEDCNLLEKIVGFESDSTTDVTLPLSGRIEDLILPTNKGHDKLLELKWNFEAQSIAMGLNSRFAPEKGKFLRIVNGFFFDSDDSGLITRHIKWIDFVPIYFDSNKHDCDTIGFNLKFMSDLVEHDANYNYPLPKEYKYKQLPKINRFIELWGNTNSKETDITSFLAKKENEFILTMKFGAIEIFSELVCEWQSEGRNDIKPDFYIVQPNGYADIVEFKLPKKEKTIVGKENRETFTAILNSYISQTRNYRTYFEDPNNRKWFEKK